MIDQVEYLNRIHFTGEAAPNQTVLAGLQRAHLFSVPFENLSIHAGQPILLQPDALFDKIVTRRRGGFCYELNGLFSLLLESIGFSVTRLSGSSANDDSSYLPEFDHLLLKVELPDDPSAAWLVDVGWGDGPIEPLMINSMDEQVQGGRVFRLREDEGFQVLEEKLVSGDWLKLYRFNQVPHQLFEFEPMCSYHSTSPDSLFTRKRLVTIFQENGRATLTDSHLIVTHGNGLRGSGEKEERDLTGNNEFQIVLRDIFGIEKV